MDEWTKKLDNVVVKSSDATLVEAIETVKNQPKLLKELITIIILHSQMDVYRKFGPLKIFENHMVGEINTKQQSNTLPTESSGAEIEFKRVQSKFSRINSKRSQSSSA